MVIVTAVYIALTLDEVHWSSATDLPSGSTAAVIGAGILVLTGFGLGWVNTAADYSRYLPRNTRAGGVVFWPTFGGSLPVVILVGYGLLLCASSSSLSAAVGNDPIGGLATVLPDWFLVPFVLVAVAGLISGAMLDLYSSGLTLLTLGPEDAALRRSRHRRRPDDPRHHLHRLGGRRQLPRHLPRLPDHPRRADGRVGRCLPGRSAAAAPRLRRGRRSTPHEGGTARSAGPQRC